MLLRAAMQRAPAAQKATARRRLPAALLAPPPPSQAPRRPLRAVTTHAAPHDLTGKTFLVTGSTDGIGQHTAVRLARAGANLIIHGRSAQRVGAAVDRVRKEQQAGGGWVKPHVADLASLADVRALAGAVRDEHPGGIHTLINNAGVYCEFGGVGGCQRDGLG